MQVLQLDAVLYGNFAAYQSKETAHGDDSACTEYLKVAAPIRAQIRKLKRNQDKSERRYVWAGGELHRDPKARNNP